MASKKTATEELSSLIAGLWPEGEDLEQYYDERSRWICRAVVEDDREAAVFTFLERRYGEAAMFAAFRRDDLDDISDLIRIVAPELIDPLHGFLFPRHERKNPRRRK